MAKIEGFAKIFDGFEPLTIFSKRSILNVWQKFYDFVFIIFCFNFIIQIPSCSCTETSTGGCWLSITDFFPTFKNHFQSNVNFPNILKICNIFYTLKLTPRKVEQPTRGIELQEKEEKDEKCIRRMVRKKTEIKGAYIICIERCT